MAEGKQSKEQENIESVLHLLALTERNQELATKYFDLSMPEQRTLLKEAEHQNFIKLNCTTKQQLFKLLQDFQKTNEQLAARMIRLVAEIGGETAQEILMYYSSWVYFNQFEYIEQFLTQEQAAVILANAAAWQEGVFFPRYAHWLIETGMEDPEVFCRMRKLCYNDEGNNTQMLVAALYLHCVKPLGHPAENDKKEGDPELIQEMTAYLVESLIQKIGGLFHEDNMPQASELETLQNFVRNAQIKEPIPDEIWTILSGRRRQDNRPSIQFQLSFQSFLAFLAIDHTDRLMSVLRIAEALDAMTVQNLPLSGCLAVGQDWFDRHILALETNLELPKDRYIYWAVAEKQTKILERMAVKVPRVICNVYENCSADDKGYLLSCIKTGNPKYFQLKKTFLVDSYRRTAAGEIVAGYHTFRESAARYLLGEIEISKILPCVGSWRKMYHLSNGAQLQNVMAYGEMQIYRRGLVLECLQLNHIYFYDRWIDAERNHAEENTAWKHKDVQQIRSLLAVLAEEKVPPQYQIEFLGNAYFGQMYQIEFLGNAYFGQTNDTVEEWFQEIAAYHKDWHSEWIAASQSCFMQTRILAICVMGVQWQEFQDELIACASKSSKLEQEYLRKIYIAHPDCEEGILAMLKSPRAAERSMAVEVLTNWSVKQYREALTKALASEKTKKIRTLIHEILYINTENETKSLPDELPLHKLIHEILIGTWKRKLSWLPLDTLPTVHQKDGEPASKEQLAAILVSYADMKELGLNKEAKSIAAQLNPMETAFYIKQVYDLWVSEGAQAKRKWVLYAAAIHGDEAVVTEIYAQLQYWAQHLRGAMAAEAVKALALSDVPTALLLVDQISRKFKYRPVKLAASKALDYAAEQFEISR